jgi:hypothetical protein
MIGTAIEMAALTLPAGYAVQQAARADNLILTRYY